MLAGGLKGLEKESLRVSADGWIAATPHPRALGSTLTHPYITTDFSEALIELITPPFADVTQTMEFLDRIHRFVYAHLPDDELLWATSMPCRVGGDDSIPIAEYGFSNIATMKHVYRVGLKHRYGSVMQTIAGLHYNYSFPDDFWSAWREVGGDWRPRQEMISEGYFRLVRNFQRFGWLVFYLFGASPAICKSFAGLDADSFSELNGTWYRPHATSLRMSDIGYHNKNQAALRISYNHLDDYVASLTRAISTPFAEYEAIGVERDGEYRQLNSNFLQIENEYYSSIRPKQVARSGERPTLALKRRGVQYVEIRALDLGVFDPVGVNEDQLRFLEAFLAFCLFQDSPPVGEEEQRQIEANQALVAERGREPGLAIVVHGEQRSVQEWVGRVCEAMRGFCELLDNAEAGTPYTDALERQLACAADPGMIPSSRVLNELTGRKESFFDFAMRKSIEHQAQFQSRPLSGPALEEFQSLVTRSLADQEAIEAADKVSFGEYLQQYFAQA